MFSQTLEYALRAMMHLASHPGEPASSDTIATATHVPAGYLSKVMRDLVVAGMVVSQRGPNGGFTLARKAGDISMYDVVSAVDPFERIHQCPLGNPAHVNLCPLHERLDRAMQSIEREFRTTSLAEVLASGAGVGDRCGLMRGAVPLGVPAKSDRSESGATN